VLNDDLPKYLNSPETPVYNKSRSLYGLNLAKSICRQTGQIIIVEGYFDVIALHQHGVRNAVATLGTSLTSEHARIIKSCVGENGKVLLVFDSDEAGIKAARRSVDVFDKEYVSAQILILDAGYDPDTFIFEHGVEVFRNRAAKALDIIPFLLNTAIRRYGLSIDGKVKIISELQNALNSLSDVVARSLYVKMISEQLEINETALVERLKKNEVSTVSRIAHPSRTMTDVRDRSTALSKASDHNRLERQIIAMMLQIPGICPSVMHSEALAFIEDPKLKRIGKTIIEIYNRLLIDSRDTAAPNRSELNQEQWIADILESLKDEKDRQLVADMAIRDEAWTIDGCEKQVLHFVETTQKKRLQRDIDTRIKEAMRRKDDDLVNELLVEKQSLAIQRERRKMALINRK
jgi:DNA primase